MGAIQFKMATSDLIAYIEKNEGLTAWQLAKRLRMSPANLSSRLKKLFDEGLIDRKHTKHDTGQDGWAYHGVRR